MKQLKTFQLATTTLLLLEKNRILRDNLSEKGAFMNKYYTYLANWKMNFTINEALLFASDHYDDLVLLSQKQNTQVVLCPSTEALHPIAQIIQGTKLVLGAQNCSEYLHGSCTGQTSPASLLQLGCSFCIIGHSEQRVLGGETNQRVAHKCGALLDCDVTPVICIGENLEQYQQGSTLETLQEQVNPIFDMLKTHSKAHVPIFIAYEPVWAIGSGNVATNEHIESVLSWLAQQTITRAPSFKWKLLYGGSVKSANSAHLKTIPQLDGFLMGGASLDFEEFEKVVNYV